MPSVAFAHSGPLTYGPQMQLLSFFSDTPLFYQRLIWKHPPTMDQCDVIAEEIQSNSLLTCSDGALCPLPKLAVTVGSLPVRFIMW